MRKIKNLVEFREELHKNLPVISSWTKGKRRGVLAGCLARLLADGVAAGKIDDVLNEFKIYKGRRHLKQYISFGRADNPDEYAFEKAIGWWDDCENKTEYKGDGKSDTDIKIPGPKAAATFAELEMPKLEDKFRLPPPKAAPTLEELEKFTNVEPKKEGNSEPVNNKYTSYYDYCKNKRTANKDY